MKKESKKQNKLFNIKVVDCADYYGASSNRILNGPYVGAVINYPDLKNVTKLRFYVNIDFDAGEPYKQIYKIVLADMFYDLDRTSEVEIVGPWIAVDNHLELEIDLTEFLIEGVPNWVIIYAGDDGYSGRTIDDPSGEKFGGTMWTYDTDTKLNNFFMESWYEAVERP